MSDILSKTSLGKVVSYVDQVDHNLLFPIPRSLNRDKINVYADALPFCGFDIWNGFEFSYLNSESIPIHCHVVIAIPCCSKFIIESKSFKLYLFSFANSKFNSQEEVISRLNREISSSVQAPVAIELYDNMSSDLNFYAHANFYLIDNYDIACEEYNKNAKLLKLAESKQIISEDLGSNLLKSNCLATGKPDWGSIRIKYTGYKIDHKALLKYLVSYRNHQGFHEHCVEEIFIDLMVKCKPQQLLVEARYNRRGGLDINPSRANYEHNLANKRLYRQ